MSNMKNISINDFNNLCRTCSESNDLVSIYENIYLMEMIVSCAQIQVQLNDELPKNICQKCIKELNQLYSFISKCRTNDAAFRKCLTEQKLLKPEENDTKFVLTEEIFIKPEMSDDNDASDECTNQNIPEFELTQPEINDNLSSEYICANCNTNFETNEEFVSHLQECQFNELITQPESEHKESTKQVDLKLIPKRSQKMYVKTYKHFMKYCKENTIETFTETVLIAYFEELSKKVKPSTLWATFTMLKATLSIKHKLDFGKYSKLRAFLKQKSNGYQPKISKKLEKEQILTFLRDAPDDTYLTTKVALVLGTAGACTCEELVRMKIDDIQDMGTKLLLTMPETKIRETRSVVISDYLHIDIFRRYATRRPRDIDSPRFFYKYSNGRASKQLIGINRFGSMPQEIATYLKLPNAKEYTGHCFRRSSNARELWD